MVSAIQNNMGGTVSLWYFRAHYFDNVMGRFISRNPLGYVDGFGLYNGYFASMFMLDFSGKGANMVMILMGVAIIAILVSLLLPSLEKTRKESRNIFVSQSFKRNCVDGFSYKENEAYHKYFIKAKGSLSDELPINVRDIKEINDVQSVAKKSTEILHFSKNENEQQYDTKIDNLLSQIYDNKKEFEIEEVTAIYRKEESISGNKITVKYYFETKSVFYKLTFEEINGVRTFVVGDKTRNGDSLKINVKSDTRTIEK